MIGQDNKIVFVRHGDQLVRVSTCRLVKVGQEFNDVNRQDQSQPQLQKERYGMIPKPYEVIEDEQLIEFDEAKESDPLMMDDPLFTDETDKVREQDVNHEIGAQQASAIRAQDETENLVLAEKDGVHHTIRREETINSMKDLPSKGDRIRYCPYGCEWIEATVLGRGGKATGKNRYYFNVQNEIDGSKVGVDLQHTEYEKIHEKETLSEYDDEDETANCSIAMTSKITQAKEKELDNWKAFEVYTEIEDRGQSTLSTRWVITEKILPEGTKGIKARLVVRGFEEEQHIRSDSPTAAKPTLRAFLAVAANQRWKCQTIDIKAAFLQGKEIERDVFLKPSPRGGKHLGGFGSLEK